MNTRNQTILDVVQDDGTILRTITTMTTQIISSDDYQKIINSKIAQQTAIANDIAQFQPILAQSTNTLQRLNVDTAQKITS